MGHQWGVLVWKGGESVAALTLITMQTTKDARFSCSSHTCPSTPRRRASAVQKRKFTTTLLGAVHEVQQSAPVERRRDIEF